MPSKDSQESIVSPEELTNSPTSPDAEPISEEVAETDLQVPLKQDLVVPPEEQLTAPSEVLNSEPENSAPVTPWLVVALNRRVNRDWEAMLVRAPENTRRCYEHLCTAPMLRKPKRVFPLKGKLYKGAWEYEVTSGDRVFYVPDEERRKVVVYYAGKHPKSTPTPP